MQPLAAVAQQATGENAPLMLRGVVTSEGRAVSGASVEVPASRALVRTDTAGRFRVTVAGDSVQLVVRAIGHTRAIRMVSLRGDLTAPVSIALTRTAALLNAVVTTATMKERYLADSPVKVELVTPALLERNASPNVMDNVSFLPGLTQQVDCGVCFTNNIRINGMEGPYTAVLIDGAPMMSALATVYGLNSIDPTLVEQIEIIRGPNSTLYGAEAMGGVINIVTKDPRLAPRMSVSASGTSNGETNLAIAAAPRLGGGRALVSVSGGHNSYFVDRNRDGFSDLPLVSRLSLMTKWTTGTPARRPFELMARVYGEDRFGGTADWMRRDRGSSTVYGESIRTWRAELLGTVRGGTVTSPFRLDVSGNLHHQNSVYGDTPYLATQRTAFAQGVWSPRIGRHDVTAGATLRLQQYADSTRAQQVDETRFIPGVFVQDEVPVGTRLSVLGGIRADHHAAHGVIASPRLALK
ncbi:MAG TPA: TonB-dependent receptor plug domain-containing protein, partial [Gemmatimonadaceae bacterium]|nr:TonB-dependent receptor plug domain-containing protein [Gemmatimonadaceae bacterium]